MLPMAYPKRPLEALGIIGGERSRHADGASAVRTGGRGLVLAVGGLDVRVELVGTAGVRLCDLALGLRTIELVLRRLLALARAQRLELGLLPVVARLGAALLELPVA